MSVFLAPETQGHEVQKVIGSMPGEEDRLIISLRLDSSTQRNLPLDGASKGFFSLIGAFRVLTPPLETEVGKSGAVVAIVASFVSALLTEPLQRQKDCFVRRSRSPVDEETLNRSADRLYHARLIP